MNRRDVLKLGGALSIALLLNASPLGKMLRSPSHAGALGVRYRGSRDGRIYTSADNGKSVTFNYCLCRGFCSFGKFFYFKKSHWTVPDNHF